ncbi:DNA repair protein RecN [Candidatus Omnitrophota bacterium]
MLNQLNISNFGLIDEITCDFHQNLNILTGETGAGKSILIDALRIALGDRITASQLHDAQKPCVIEAIFDLSAAVTLLKDQDVFDDFMSDDDTSLIIHRTYPPDGRHKIKINGKSVTVAQLKQVGNFLVDFHGAHDHQMLLSSDAHMGMLDRLVDFKDVLAEYQSQFDAYGSLLKQLDDLRSKASSRERECDLLSHQIKELKQVELLQEKLDDLLAQKVKINNAEKIHTNISEVLSFLEGENLGVSEGVRKAYSPMRTLNDIDAMTDPWMTMLDTLQSTNDELISQLHDYGRSLSFEPQEAEQINEQCDLYDDIKRKYGPTLEDASIYLQEATEKYDLLINLEHNEQELCKQIATFKKKLSAMAKKLTDKRKKAATLLEETIVTELGELGFNHVQFECRFEPVALTTLGQEKIIFYISPNAGEELKPLSEIVSSGEAARVMLALKKALIKVDPVPVLIFDEIDAQIGGRLGEITGKKLKKISSHRQVILITHLPQIASFADNHLKVIKSVKNKRTITEVLCLDQERRINELAKMMSGEKESSIALKHAKDLLQKAAV